MARSVDGTPQIRGRQAKSLVIIIAIPFLALFARLFWLQIIQGQKFLDLSTRNRVVLETIPASRGTIYDRNGVVLARNRPSYAVTFLPYTVPKGYDLREKLLKIVDRQGIPLFDTLELDKLLEQTIYRKSKIHRLKEDISMEYVSVIREHMTELPGIDILSETRREYPLAEACNHMLGYLGAIPEDESDSMKLLGYQPGDLIGKAGIEQKYQDMLRGKDGIRYVEKNVYGRRLGVVADMPDQLPERGKNLYLTIDADLQKIAVDSFPDSIRGAVVALDPRTGEVLAMISNPTFDPNIFSLDPKKRAKEWAKVALDPARPLSNRAVNGVYPPGSTFKLVSGLSFVDHGSIASTGHMAKSCGGYYRIGNRVARCWYSGGHGYTDLADAIKVSCNVYFYQGGLLVGDKVINDYSTRFGLGVKTGIDLPYEKAGWQSGEEAYNERFKKKKGWRWTPGMVLDLAIGQQQVFTPIQLAVMVAAMGNEKYRYVPYLLKEIRAGNNAVEKQFHGVDSIPLNAKHESILQVKEGMRRVVMEPGGTGHAATVPGIVVGGKTGSAENPHGKKTHGLFVCVAPLDNPVIAIAVVAENAGHGGSVAAPVAGAMLRYYFNNTAEGRRVMAEHGVILPPKVDPKAVSIPAVNTDSLAGKIDSVNSTKDTL